MQNPSQLLQFTQKCLEPATEHVPPCSFQFSKSAFTQSQLITLYCLKLKLGVSYRELIDRLREMPRIQEALGLLRLPPLHTVSKAFARLETAVWRVLQRVSASRVEGEGDRVAALDASGRDRYARRHYTQRVSRQGL